MRKVNILKRTKKQSFTLIELIAVILTITIVTVMIFTTVSPYKDAPRATAISSDAWNLQSAIDLYQLDHNGRFPVIEDSGVSPDLSLGNAKPLDLDALHPQYIRNFPQTEGMYYWVDYQGKLYYSTLKSPTDFTQEDVGLLWTEDEEASTYKIYEVQSESISSSSQPRLKLIAELGEDTSPYRPADYSVEKTYLINVADKYGYEAPPVKANRTAVVAGGYHSLIIDESGDLWSYGYNQYGQLGHAENAGTDSPTSTPIKVMSNVKSVSAGAYHTLVIKENGDLFSFGNNQYGQLGDSTNSGTPTANYEPIQIMSGVKSVAAGHYHTLVVKENGELWSFGQNLSGQLGYATNVDSHIPNPVPQLVMRDIKSVSGGEQHSLAIGEDGILWSFGLNYHGQLGHDKNTTTYKGNPVPAPVMSDVQSVSAGAYHSLALLDAGELWTFGNNTYGQLGYSGNSSSSSKPKQILSDIKMVAGGAHHTIMLSESGEFLVVGQISLDPFKHQIEKGSHSSNSTPRPVRSGVKSLSAGHYHTLFVDDSLELWSFGYNRHGELGYHTNEGAGNDSSELTQILLEE